MAAVISSLPHLSPHHPISKESHLSRFTEYALQNGATLSVGANAGVSQPNTARSDSPLFTAVVTVASITLAPSLLLNLMTSVDDVNFALAATSSPAITAAGTYRFVFNTPVYEPFIRLDTPVTGTGTLVGVTLYLLASGAEEN